MGTRRLMSAEVPPHAPLPSRFKRWLGPFYITGSFWFGFHRRAVSVLPEWAIRVVTGLFVALFFVLLRRIRRAIAQNLDAVLGPCGFWERQRRIYRTMSSFGWCVSERYEWIQGLAGIESQMEGLDNWHGAGRDGRGVLVVTAHIGHWETASITPVAEEGRHVHLVREAETDPEAQRMVAKLMAGLPDEYVVHFAGGDVGLGARLLEVLRSGNVVALQGDRPRAEGRKVEVELFGRPVDFPAGPFALARAAGVAVLPVFSFRTGRRRSVLVFREPIEVGPAGPEAVAVAASRLAAEVEWAIRREPHQWFCFRELWPE